MSFRDRVVKELVEACKSVRWSIRLVLDQQTLTKELAEIRRRSSTSTFKP